MFSVFVSAAGYLQVICVLTEACLHDWSSRGAINVVEMILFVVLSLHSLVRFTCSRSSVPTFERLNQIVVPEVHCSVALHVSC